MGRLYCTRAALVAAALAVQVPVTTARQLPPRAAVASAPTSSLTIFIRGVIVGSEQTAVTRTADGWTIAASGRLGVPFDIVTRRLEVRYDQNWKPIELAVDAAVRGQEQTLHVTVSGTTIRSELTAGTRSNVTTAMGDADLLLPSAFFAPYEALAARLRTAASGSTLSAYVGGQAPIVLTVGEIVPDRIQTATQFIEAQHSRISIKPSDAGAPFEAEIWADGNGRLLRLSIPVQALEVVREDVASVAARRVPISRPNDEQVKIPSNGFSLAGTISRPAEPGAQPLPAVVFIGGSGPMDRDEQTAGIPILGELAGAAADAGFLTLRYDKRGVGQSGGRIESAAFSDLADDVRSAVKLLSERKDVDPRRIAVVGYSEGGPVALMAGSKDKRIAGIGLLASHGIVGKDLILEQQQHLLGRTNLSESDKQSWVEAQKKIHDAVITGKGWEALPPEARRQADNTEFQSLLVTDPAKILPGVRQPLFILQGELDTEVAPVNADRLEALARKRKNAREVEVVKLPDVNHLLARATTGEADEYGTLADRHVSADASRALVAWLQEVLAAK